MTMTGGDADTVGMLKHLRFARELGGEWSYVRIGGDFTDQSIDHLERLVAACRALHLIPVLTSFKLPDEYYEPDNPDQPKYDSDGTLTSHEKAYEEWLRKLYARGVTIPYFEYGNEVNGGFFAGSPEVYARMLIAASKGFKQVDPNLSFGTAGMAGCALDFYTDMLNAVPELIEHVDHWGFHPYGVNHPPGYVKYFDDYGLDCHTELVKLLEQFGVEDPVLIATETGYEINNHRDKRFPKITEELRARYLTEAYRDHWVPSPNIRAIMLFVLQDVRWQGWNGWDLIREDYSLTPTFKAIRDMPKPQGVDYLPRGTAGISGKIRESRHLAGIEDVVVWIRRPGGPAYAGITDANGEYLIADVPPGEYTISCFRTGFQSSPELSVTLYHDQTGIWNAIMVETGLLNALEGNDGLKYSPGWSPLTDDDVYMVDEAVKRTGNSSQKITADGKLQGIWQFSNYESAQPGRVYAAEVWVKTKGLQPGDGRGVVLGLDISDSYARLLFSAETVLDITGDSEWQPVTVAIMGTPTGRRMQLRLEVEAMSGEVWFDDVFLHESRWPLPSDTHTAGLGATLTGSVTGERPGQEGEFLLDSLVYTSPLGRWSVANSLGRYEFRDLPLGRYTLSAVHPRFAPSGDSLNLEQNHTERNILLRQKTYPTEIQNPGFEELPSHPTWFRVWRKFGTAEGIHTAGWHAGVPGHPEGFAPRTGQGFYGALAGSNVKDGGIFQTIQVEPHALYEVSAWTFTYQTEGGNFGDVASRIGVDPRGGEDVNAPYIIWSPLSVSQNQWSKISVRVRPVENHMTVFLHHLQVQGLMYVCNLFDDVEVVKIGEADPSLNAPME